MECVFHIFLKTQNNGICDSVDCSMPGFPVLHYIPEFAQTHVHWVSDAIQPSHPMSPPSAPVLNLSQYQGLSQWVHSSHQVVKSIGTSASASILPMNIQGFPLGWTGLISLAVQGILKSLLQHRSSKASILRCSAFCMVQLWHPYMTTRKTLTLTIWAFVGKVMSLLFNMLFRLALAFLPRSKRLLISRLQSPSAVILEPPKIKSVTASTVSSSFCHYVMGPDAMILVFWMLSFKPASLLAQTVKNLPAMQETQVWSLGRDDPLEKGMATHSNSLAWRSPWTEEPGGL